MEVSYPIGMALYDFVPVIFFLVGGLYLARIIVMTLNKSLSWIFISGVALIFLGGALKASWKLLVSANIADIVWMSESQFILMAIGYLCFFIPLIVLARSERQHQSQPIYAIAMWKLPFLLVMTLASLGAYATLAVISFRRQLKWAAAGYMVSFIGVMLMGFLASRTQTLSLQWIEQNLNSIINLSFAISSFFLYRHFLPHLQRHTSY